MWKSRKKDYYVGVTLHFIDDSWVLHNVAIAMKHITGSHTSEVVGETVFAALKPFLNDSVIPVAGVLDGGDIGSVKVTSDKFGGMFCLTLPHITLPHPVIPNP